MNYGDLNKKTLDQIRRELKDKTEVATKEQIISEIDTRVKQAYIDGYNQCLNDKGIKLDEIGRR
jgi:hypothetical protein